MRYPNAFDNELVFESYGVRVKLEATNPALFSDVQQTAKKALVERFRILESKEAEHTFGFAEDENGTLYMYRNGEQLSFDDSRMRFFKFFNSILRIVVAEHAQGSIFIHAGVVGWRGKAIIIPANSFQGKTTLVAELVRNGAEYYSDEYAVLDGDGLVHPFPRDLSFRSTRNGQLVETDVPARDLGGSTGVNPIPVGAVLLTEYDAESEWKPRQLTAGQGILEIIPHTIPRNSNTEFSLKVLNTAVSDAIILKSPRGDAGATAIKFLSFFDSFTNLAKII